jgi:hypothetical protein
VPCAQRTPRGESAGSRCSHIRDGQEARASLPSGGLRRDSVHTAERLRLRGPRVLRNRLEGVLACSGSAPRMRGHPPRLETRDHPTYGEIGNFDLTVVTENGETMVSEELSRGGGCRSPPRGPRAAFHASDREAPSIPVGMLRRLDLARPRASRTPATVNLRVVPVYPDPNHANSGRQVGPARCQSALGGHWPAHGRVARRSSRRSDA